MAMMIIFMLVLLLVACPSNIEAAFEYFQLVHQWPNALCNDYYFTCRVPMPSPNNFTIHGLWPDNYTQPLFSCTRTSPYTQITDANLLPVLNAVWPDLEPQTRSPQKFWEHEWNKHGTCSLNLYDQTEYFTLAARLKNEIYLLNILQSKGISRGSYPSLNQVNSTIATAVGKVPDLECSFPVRHPRQGVKGVKQLKEIRICYATDGRTIIDCPSTRSYRSVLRSETCLNSANGQIYFP